MDSVERKARGQAVLGTTARPAPPRGPVQAFGQTKGESQRAWDAAAT